MTAPGHPTTPSVLCSKHRWLWAAGHPGQNSGLGQLASGDCLGACATPFRWYRHVYAPQPGASAFSLALSSPKYMGQGCIAWHKPGLLPSYLVNGIWVFRHIEDDGGGSPLHCSLCLQQTDRAHEPPFRRPCCPSPSLPLLAPTHPPPPPGAQQVADVVQLPFAFT